MQIKIALIFLATILAIDLIWLKGASKMHNATVQAVQKSPLQINFLWAAAFYVLAVIAFLFIVIPLSKGDPVRAGLYGALCGLLMYGTFDFVNKAIFKEYPTGYALADTAWGTFVMGSAAFVVVRIFSSDNRTEFKNLW